MRSLASKEYWDDHWDKAVLEIAAEGHPVRKWIEENVSVKKGDSCFEVGCYPGKFLAVLGDKGCDLHGIDLFHKTALMSDWLRNRGYGVGEFHQSDFLDFNTSESYDIVCSFGFIEHFKNWRELIKKHMGLTKENGLTVIEVPNLSSPLYRLLYKVFEPNVLKNHEFSAMNLSSIVNTLKDEGCEIRTAQYVGSFYFRFVATHNRYAEILAKLINCLSPLFNLLPRSLSARYIGVIAAKK